MQILAVSSSICLILIVLWDAFEVIILPRRVTRRFRLARLFYRSTWWPWKIVAGRMRKRARREVFLSFYGPISLVFLLSVWAAGIILGFALLHESLNTPIRVENGSTGFLPYLYLSGSTFFTLGLGEVGARGSLGGAAVFFEWGRRVGFVCVVVGCC